VGATEQPYEEKGALPAKVAPPMLLAYGRYACHSRPLRSAASIFTNTDELIKKEGARAIIIG